MLIINTESETLSKTRMIYLYINGHLVDKLKSNQVKQYNLDPGKYQIQARMNFYLTEAEIVEVKANGHTAYELTLKSNWRMFAIIIPLMILGAVIDYFLRGAFGGFVGNIFITLYFVAIFYVNSRISRKGFLELKEIQGGVKQAE